MARRRPPVSSLDTYNVARQIETILGQRPGETLRPQDMDAIVTYSGMSNKEFGDALAQLGDGSKRHHVTVSLYRRGGRNITADVAEAARTVLAEVVRRRNAQTARVLAALETGPCSTLTVTGYK